MDIEFRDGRWWRLARCGHETSYSNKGNCQKAVRNDKICQACARLPENNGMYGRVGEQNPFYGKHHTQELKDKFSAERTGKSMPEGFSELQRRLNGERLRGYANNQRGKTLEEIYGDKAVEIRNKMSLANSGANNSMYGKPAPLKSGNGYQGWIDERFFRSLRELAFILEHPEAISAESKYWTAHYEWLGAPRTTRPDFLIEETKTIYEVKPLKLHNSPLVSAKAEAMRELVESREYKFELIDVEIPTVEVLRGLLDSGRVVLTERTKEKMDRWLNL